jgi:8-oxo-dGTP diphosphatase
MQFLSLFVWCNLLIYNEEQPYCGGFNRVTIIRLPMMHVHSMMIGQVRNWSCSSRLTMIDRYTIATLLYCFNDRDEVLLLKRTQDPNRGLWSPCGGKLKMASGESPYACACREAGEEMGMVLRPEALHLTGLVSEHGYEGQAHWLMFLFEIKPRLQKTPPPHKEGCFRFFSRAELERLDDVPRTDKERIWPWFWRYRGSFFAAHCHCRSDGRNEWNLEES